MVRNAMTQDTISAPVQTVENGLSSSRSDYLAIEEPLQLCLNGSPLSITMRTPGSDLDLATGFLVTEGIIEDVSQILSIRAETEDDNPETSGDTVTITLKRFFRRKEPCSASGKISAGTTRSIS